MTPVQEQIRAQRDRERELDFRHLKLRLEQMEREAWLRLDSLSEETIEAARTLEEYLRDG